MIITNKSTNNASFYYINLTYIYVKIKYSHIILLVTVHVISVTGGPVRNPLLSRYAYTLFYAFRYVYHIVRWFVAGKEKTFIKVKLESVNGQSS